MVGIVHKVRWIKSNSKKFSKYIDYIDREEAVRNYKFEDFSLYNDYMDNPSKSGNLFTADKDFLNEYERKALKNYFSIAQENESLMWQDVFSFDNEWLEKEGLYDKKTGVLNEKKIIEAVRSSMNELIKKEGFDNLLWSGSLHYNTDNIHVHVASVEVNPSRERGKRKPKTLINMKSKFANNLIDRSREQKEINDIIRKNIIDSKKDFSFHKDMEMKRMVLEIIKKLPEDKRQWHYNYNSLSEVRPLLDELTKYYVDNYKKEEFKKLEDLLDKETEYLKKLYGEGEPFRYKDYKKNKIDELYTRMGNTLLKEIKEVIKNNNESLLYSYKSKTVILTKRDINKLKKVFDKDFEQVKNQMAYERLQREIENER